MARSASRWWRSAGGASPIFPPPPTSTSTTTAAAGSSCRRASRPSTTPVGHLIKRATPEEKQAQQAAKETERAARDAEKERQREEQARGKLRQEFFASPAGQARTAFGAGVQIFQCAFDVKKTQTFHIAMLGAYSAPKSSSDPSDVLNSICNEGWDLVNGSFVFLETGSESRDKFLASGQNIAVSGTIIGYYLFKRCEANRRETTNPWDAPQAVAEIAAAGNADSAS